MATWNGIQMQEGPMYAEVSSCISELTAKQWPLAADENESEITQTSTQQHVFQDIIGNSPALKNVLSEVITVAPTGATVLVEGETGTGKELIARAIHHLSPRREKKFVSFNCAAVPAGLRES